MAGSWPEWEGGAEGREWVWRAVGAPRFTTLERAVGVGGQGNESGSGSGSGDGVGRR